MVKITLGKSESDRITFFEKKDGATAIRKENGEIEIKYEKKEETTKQAIWLIILFLAVSLIKSFLIMPHINTETNTRYLYLIPAGIYLLLAIMSIIIIRETGKTSFLKNHGAEHKVLAAYNKLKRIPTVEEAQKFSRISKYCGITIYSAFFTAQLIGFFLYTYAGFRIYEWILFLVPLFFPTIFPLNILGKLAQFWTTSEPEDENVELAIASIRALENREEAIKNLTKAFINAFFR